MKIELKDYTTVENIKLSFFFAVAFGSIQLILLSPLFYKSIEKTFSSRKNVKKEEIHRIVHGFVIRIICFIHNSFQILFALKALSDTRLWNDVLRDYTPFSQLVLDITTGFFMWDTISSICYIKSEGIEFVYHGSLCLVFYIYCVLFKRFHFFACGFIMWELSTPMVQARWILKVLGLNNTTAYLINGILMITVFFACRILWGTYLMLWYYNLSNEEMSLDYNDIGIATFWAFRFLGVLLTGLNYYWFSKMVTIGFRLITGKKKKKVNHKLKNNKMG